MTDIMTHRGPDDRGTVSRPGFALGVRRLRIVDVAGGRQPVSDESGSIFAVQKRNDCENLVRLAESWSGRPVPPKAWIVVDNGSTDGGLNVAHERPGYLFLRTLHGRARTRPRSR